MRAAGIVCEFDPFHEGHRHLIREARARLSEKDGDFAVVCIMSGAFTQRGLPAWGDKWERAKNAVLGGADLVVELPAVYACASAQLFARGAVRILAGFGTPCILAFGSESGDAEILSGASLFLSENMEKIRDRIPALLKEGLSFPAAREKAACALDPSYPAEILRQPNDLLATEYLTQARLLGLSPEAIAVKRIGRGHHSSASGIRESEHAAQPERYENAAERLFAMTAAKILAMSEEELDRIASSGGGLGRRLKHAVRGARTFDELAAAVKTKAYTRTRTDRLLAQILLGIQRDLVDRAQVYIRPLAMNRTGARLLKEIREEERSDLPIVTKPAEDMRKYPAIRETLAKDIYAQDLFLLLYGEDLYTGSDYVRHPFVAETEKSF
ncbi:MAG: nucleotidyltransferase family protein [Firmicutes bacterium]|nr:nucleotidyltransferase family protein [Bacillota bacterium]